MKYKLSQNMYWLPGYEDRYAVTFGHKDIFDSTRIVQLYSFVSPGSVGQPYPLSRTISGRWAITKRGSRWKTTLSDEEVTRFVKTSPAYKKAQQEHLTHMMPKTKPVTAQREGYTGWIIGDLTKGNISFSEDPKTHPTEREAYVEAERLARKYPGTTFIVFKAVRSVVSGGLVVTNL